MLSSSACLLKREFKSKKVKGAFKGKKVKRATPLGVKGGTPGGVAFYGCTTKGFMVVQLKGIWLYS